jgi:UDPglucose--hexose-1-phosphate uridylyltransferase
MPYEPPSRWAGETHTIMTDTTEGKWEQRWHPLRREWIVYSAHRNTRPWSGAVEPPRVLAPEYDPSCYLCPGNKRVHGDINPDYKDIFVFDNDHPVVGAGAPGLTDKSEKEFLYRKKPASGIARVICYDPRHNVTLSDINRDGVAKVLICWRDQTRDLKAAAGIKHVLIFENKGEIVGVSSPHPHCQLYAVNFVFKNIANELDAAREFKSERGKNIFTEIIAAELNDGARIVAQNEHAAAFIPFFAQYAYEAWVFPQKRHATFATMSDEELDGLAGIYQELIRRYDLLYKMSFPYVMAVYQAPFDGDYPDYHLHLVFLPPLRQPGIKKHPAGPEIGGGNFMADTMPEEKAAELRAIDVGLFKDINF